MTPPLISSTARTPLPITTPDKRLSNEGVVTPEPAPLDERGGGNALVGTSFVELRRGITTAGKMSGPWLEPPPPRPGTTKALPELLPLLKTLSPGRGTSAGSNVGMETGGGSGVGRGGGGGIGVGGGGAIMNG